MKEVTYFTKHEKGFAYDTKTINLFPKFLQVIYPGKCIIISLIPRGICVAAVEKR